MVMSFYGLRPIFKCDIFRSLSLRITVLAAYYEPLLMGFLDSGYCPRNVGHRRFLVTWLRVQNNSFLTHGETGRKTPYYMLQNGKLRLESIPDSHLANKHDEYCNSIDYKNDDVNSDPNFRLSSQK